MGCSTTGPTSCGGSYESPRELLYPTISDFHRNLLLSGQIRRFGPVGIATSLHVKVGKSQLWESGEMTREQMLEWE